MATNQDTESLEKTLETTLEKTDLGHIINENKRPILIVGGIILLLIAGYSVMNTMKANKKMEVLDAMFKVEDSVFNAHHDAKIDDQAFKTAFISISNEFKASPNLIPSMLKSLNTLEANKTLDEATLKEVGLWLNKMDKKNYLYLFSAIRVAALYENHNKTAEAITLLEGLLANKTEFMSDKIEFELGRLYKQTGNNDKAKAHFTNILNLKDESELKSLARIYLSEL